jgi:hypothetical protein
VRRYLSSVRFDLFSFKIWYLTAVRPGWTFEGMGWGQLSWWVPGRAHSLGGMRPRCQWSLFIMQTRRSTPEHSL